MSAIASFALECAQSGRWVRGLMALHGHTCSTEPRMRQACVAVAQIAAAHAWQAALELLHPTDAVQHTGEVCRVFDTVSRQPDLSVRHYEAHVAALLKALTELSARESGAGAVAAASDVDHSTKGNNGNGDRSAAALVSASASPPYASLAPSQAARQHAAPPSSPLPSSSVSAAEVQRRVFLSATRWSSCESAELLFECLPPPVMAAPSCTERVRQLRTLRRCVMHDVGPFAQWCEDGEGGEGSQQSSTPSRATGGVSATKSCDEVQSNAAALASLQPAASLAEQLRHLQDNADDYHRSPQTDGGFSGRQPQQQRRYSARDLRELRKLREMKRQALLQRASAEEHQLFLQYASAVAAPSTLAVCAALRTLTRLRSAQACDAAAAAPSPPSSTSLSSLLSQLHSTRLTPEVALLYARAVGLRCPHLWATALHALSRAEVRHGQRHHFLLVLWLTAQGSWSAALRMLAEAPRGSGVRTSMALESVLRTAVPAPCVHRLAPQLSRPWLRLRSSGDGSSCVSPLHQLAAALASGVRLDEVQLSELGRRWAEQGQWLRALQLYYRLPLPEFQKYATQSMVKARPELRNGRPPAHREATSSSGGSAVSSKRKRKEEAEAKSQEGWDVMAALRLLVPRAEGIQYSAEARPRPAPPLETYATCLLIHAAPTWSAALRVFRECVRGGTRCNAQVLSALMDHADLPSGELRQVLRSYPAAVNDGVRRRAKEQFRLTDG